MPLRNHRVAAVAAGAAILVGCSSFGAVAGQFITSSDIGNGEVHKADIGKDAVGSNEILNGSVHGRDLADGLLSRIATSGTDGAPGPQGPKGDQGPVGPAGPQGPKGDDATVGISHWSVGATIAPGDYQEVVANCQAPGHLAISGGYTAGTYKGGVEVVLDRNTVDDESQPGIQAQGWIVGFRNNTDTDQNVRTWVVCASVVEAEPTS